MNKVSSSDFFVFPNNWKDEYILLDSGDGERLEKFGRYVFRRPDPQCLWKRSLSDEQWNRCDAEFVKQGDGDKGKWRFHTRVPERWVMQWQDVSFYAEPTPFKHVGVFPEQAVHWEWMKKKISGSKRKLKILNLFGYTGIASVVCAKAGASVTHVDASKPSIGWAKENMLLSGLPPDSIRWILEDVVSFVKREVRRGSTYDGIIMDPPAFGHGAKGEVWKFHEQMPELFEACGAVLSPDPMFMIVNAYAVSVSALMLQNSLEDFVSHKGTVTCGELALEQQNGRMLSTGIYARWER